MKIIILKVIMKIRIVIMKIVMIIKMSKYNNDKDRLYSALPLFVMSFVERLVY